MNLILLILNSIQLSSNMIFKNYFFQILKKIYDERIMDLF